MQNAFSLNAGQTPGNIKCKLMGEEEEEVVTLAELRLWDESFAFCAQVLWPQCGPWRSTGTPFPALLPCRPPPSSIAILPGPGARNPGRQRPVTGSALSPVCHASSRNVTGLPTNGGPSESLEPAQRAVSQATRARE